MKKNHLIPGNNENASELKKKLDYHAAKRQKHSNISMLLALIGLIAVVAGLFTGAITKGWVVLGGFFIFAVALIYAGFLADPMERAFYETFEEGYMRPILNERFPGGFKYNRKKGFTKAELKAMRLMHPIRKHETRRMLSVNCRGIDITTCHAMFVKGRGVSEKRKQRREMVCFIQGQFLKLSGTGVSVGSIMIRPVGVYDTEGVRYRRSRPEMLVIGAGTEDMNKVYEVLSTEPDAAAEFLDEARCGRLLRVRRILKHYSPNTGIFMWLHGDMAEVLLTNWDNGLMPSMNTAMKESYYPACVTRTANMIDCVAYIFNGEQELPPFDFELEEEV
ncbi:MAG: hypothetical protein IJA35_05500 [Clostridia bacterium]|nr:hypothetical protein [Clostridia bacterium]